MNKQFDFRQDPTFFLCIWQRNEWWCGKKTERVSRKIQGAYPYFFISPIYNNNVIIIMSNSSSNSKNSNYSADNFPSHLMPYLEAVQEIVNEPLSPDTVVPDPPVVVLAPWLYLAPMSCVFHKAHELSEQDFTHVLSTNAMVPSVLQTVYYELLEAGIAHGYVAGIDILSYDMMGHHWEECHDFLQQALNDGNANDDNTSDNNNDNDKKPPPSTKVLVHCEAGMNRSGTIVAAAMMYFGNNTLLSVLRTLKRQRGRVMTNTSFQQQLVLFAEQLGKLGPLPPTASSASSALGTT